MPKNKVAKKVLIVEDEPFLRDILVKRFTAAGYEVSFVINGEEAISAVLRDKPDMLLLDFAMPLKNGFEVMQELKKQDMLPLTIVISNSGDTQDINAALELGAKLCVVKAKFNLDDLVARVKELLAAYDTKPEKLESKQRVTEAILVVEDDEFIRDILVRALKMENFNILTAEDGEKALEILESAQGMPILILLDIVLPGISGFEVLRKVKENEKTKGISVIILSNLGQRSEIEEGLKLGAAKFLVKANFLPDQIIEVVKATLNKK